MARPLRIEFSSAIYHVTVRGVERRRLFRSDGDRLHVLEKLREGVETYQLDVFLYCLMENHLHLVVGTPAANLGAFMGWWLTAYTVYFNRKYRRHGHLTQGRYGAKLVQGDEYLLKLSRYVHLNPVQTDSMKACSVDHRLERLRGYPWSSYRGYSWAQHEDDFVRYEPLRELVARGRKDKRHAYRSYVERGLELSEEDWLALSGRSRIAMGSESFIAEMEGLYKEMATERSRPEDIALRRVGSHVEPERVLEAVAREFAVPVAVLKKQRRNVWDRAVASRCLVQYSGMTQRDVADMLGLRSGAAVSSQLRKLKSELVTNSLLSRHVDAIHKTLQGSELNC